MKVLINEKSNKEKKLMYKDNQIEIQKCVINSQNEKISILNESWKNYFIRINNLFIYY